MSEKTNLQIDKESRDRIVNETNKNFFVEAGAGSGKTTMLVNRMVAMVESGTIPIDKICAITFTKAAANEFYERFQKILIERSDPNYKWEDKGYAGQLKKPDDDSRKCCADALENINKCFMGTIDAFCGMVLTEHPSEAGIPSDAHIVSDSETEIFYKQQFVKICNGDYGKDHKKLADVFCSYLWDPADAFAQGMLVLMNNRNAHFKFTKSNVSDIDKEFALEREAVIKAVKFLIEHTELKYDDKETDKKAWAKIEEAFSKINCVWSSNITQVISGLKKLENLPINQTELMSYRASLTDIFELVDAKKKPNCVKIKKVYVLPKVMSVQYSASMEFLTACVPYLEKAMCEKGHLTYFDYLYYLRNMLQKDADNGGKLIKHISNRYSYFLIDEFQDTNPLQAEIFFYLASDNPVSQWDKCIPRDGSLFIVGDPKQSIYRFRGADVASFLKVKKLFKDDEILILSRNFRSTKMICEYFNSTFSKMLTIDEEQSEFKEIPTEGLKNDEFQGIYSYKVYTGNLEKNHPEETDPKQIAKIIENLVDNEEYKIRSGSDEALRNLRYSDFMVITSSKKKLGPIMSSLNSKNIPTRVEGRVPFGENEALREIFKIYAAVSNIDDNRYLYGALTGKIIGVSDDDLFEYKNSNFNISLKQRTLKVVEEMIKLKSLSVEAKGLSPASLFSKIIDTYMIYKTVETENLEVVYYTLELLRNAEKSGLIISLKEGVDYVSKLIEGYSDEERCLNLNDKLDAVHLANLHKVKGLEAPVIILAASTKFNGFKDKRIVHANSVEGYLFNLPKKDQEGNSKGSFFETREFKDDIEKDEGNSLESEHKRLVYVAATRARNVLIICNSITSREGKEISMSIWSKLGTQTAPNYFDEIKCRKSSSNPSKNKADSDMLYKDAEKTCVLNDRSGEEATYKLEKPSTYHISSKMDGEQETDTSSDEIVVNGVEGNTGNEVTVFTTNAGSAVPDTDSSSGSADDNTSDDNDEKTSVKTVVSEVHEFPTLLGTVTHRLMEMLVSAKNKMDAEKAVNEILKEYITVSMEEYKEKLRIALLEVAQKMRAGGYAQTNGLPQDILNTLISADEVYCEVPFSYTENGIDGTVLWNGIMDVVYREGNNWHIVDYKTNVEKDNLDIHYKNQMAAYVKAFKETTGLNADAKTYHIDI